MATFHYSVYLYSFPSSVALVQPPHVRSVVQTIKFTRAVGSAHGLVHRPPSPRIAAAVARSALAPFPRLGTYPVQSRLWCNHRIIQLKKVSKNSKKNLECASQPTSYIYKISGSNSSSSRSYKKNKKQIF